MASNLADDLKALAGKLSGVKPGVQTTEFTVAAVFGISSLLVTLGIVHAGIPAADRPEVQAFAAVAAALISVGYSVSRAIAKHQPVNVISDLNTLYAAIGTGDTNAQATLAALLPSLAGDAGVSPSEYAKLKAGLEQVVSDVKSHTDILAELKKLIGDAEGKGGDPIPPADPVPAPVVAPVDPGQMPVTPPGLVTPDTAPPAAS